MKKLILFLTLLLFPFCDKILALELSEIENNISQLNERIITYENSVLNKTYPIGSVFETTSYSSVSQVEKAFGGEWQIYGSGRILVGINSSDSNFNVVDKTGGNSSITLVTTNLPGHTHSIPALTISTSASGAHSHNITAYNDQSGYGATIPAGAHFFKQTSITWSGTTALSDRNRLSGLTALTSGAHKHNITTTASTAEATGSGVSFSNIQPSIAVYRYRRIS